METSDRDSAMLSSLTMAEASISSLALFWARRHPAHGHNWLQGTEAPHVVASFTPAAHIRREGHTPAFPCCSFLGPPMYSAQTTAGR